MSDGFQALKTASPADPRRVVGSVQLSVLVGPGSLQPASRAVLDSLEEAEVRADDVGSSGFQLRFSVDKQSPLPVSFLLADGAPLLFLRMALVVTVNGVSNVLIDGVVTNNEFSPGDKGSNSTLTLTGKDLTALMDQSDRSSQQFPASKAEGRVGKILEKYATFGIKTQIVPVQKSQTLAHTQRIPGQQGTDLQYIRSLAQKVGYVFYLEPGAKPGTSTAYWGPQKKFGIGSTQPALSADLDAHTNVESLDFSVNQEQNRTPDIFVNFGSDGIHALSIPSSTSLNPSLGKIPPKPANTLKDLIPFRDDLTKLPDGQADMLGRAAASRNTESVTCHGSLDVTRYGAVLQARRLVGVRGCRPPFDGLYYVKTITHKIKRGEYKQSFTLTRNGLGSTVDRVVA